MNLFALLFGLFAFADLDPKNCDLGGFELEEAKWKPIEGAKPFGLEIDFLKGPYDLAQKLGLKIPSPEEVFALRLLYEVQLRFPEPQKAAQQKIAVFIARELIRLDGSSQNPPRNHR